MKTIKLNGTDCTYMFTRTGYVVKYRSVQGNNGGMMLDGSYTEDELALKVDINIPIMPLSEEVLGELLSIIYSEPYVDVYFFDPKEKKYRESVFRRNQTEEKYRGFGSDGKEYWTCTSITLMEK